MCEIDAPRAESPRVLGNADVLNAGGLECRQTLMEIFFSQRRNPDSGKMAPAPARTAAPRDAITLLRFQFFPVSPSRGHN